MIALKALAWLLSPVGKILMIVLSALAVVGGLFLKGRSAGIKAERTRSAKKVRKVQQKMDAETDKTLNDDELVERLRNGGF